MSLSALNYPPLFAAVGAGTLFLLPIVDQAFNLGEQISFAFVKGATLLAYDLSIFSVSRPGRSDGKEYRRKQARTLVPPAGWAFAIWGPIYLGELGMVGSLLLADESSPVAPIVRKLVAPYVAAQVFQTLWTKSYRPSYKGLYKYLSATSLTLTAYALSHVYAAYRIRDLWV